MIQRQQATELDKQEPSTRQDLMNETFNKHKELGAHLSEQELAQLARKIYLLLQQEWQLEQERWL